MGTAVLTATPLGRVPEICASANAPAIGAMGIVTRATAPLFPNTDSTRALGTKARSKETVAPIPPIDTSQRTDGVPRSIGKTKLKTKSAYPPC